MRRDTPAENTHAPERWAGTAPLRVLVGPFDRAEHGAYMRGAFDDFDAITFGSDPNADRIVAAGAHMRTVFDHLPEGWAPDLVLWWRPEYSVWPRGLRDLPVPVAMLTSDWYLAWSGMRAASAHADVVVTGTRGHAVFRAAGIDDVIALPMLGYEPSIDGAVTHSDRDVDVLCAGNPAWSIHAERARVVDTLMDLPPSVNFVHPPYVDRVTYNRWLARSRIFVDQTVIGEINMKVYEVPAAGACLFVERDNLDVADVLVDGESVVLFDREDLLEKTLHYLAHDEEREAIADAGRETMARHTYRRNMRTIVERLRERGPDALLAARERRPAPPLPERPWAAHAVTRCEATDADTLERIEEATAPTTPRDETLRAIARLRTHDAARPDGRDELRKSLERLQAVAADAPEDPCLHVTASIVATHAGAPDSARAHLDRAIRALSSPAPLPEPDATVWAFDRDTVIRLERATWEAVERGASPVDAVRRQARAACHVLRARWHEATGRHDAAIEDLRSAVELDPEGQDARPPLARLLDATGAHDEGLAVLDAHLLRHPLDLAAEVTRLAALLRAGRIDEARGHRNRFGRRLGVLGRTEWDPVLVRLDQALSSTAALAQRS